MDKKNYLWWGGGLVILILIIYLLINSSSPATSVKTNSAVNTPNQNSKTVPATKSLTGNNSATAGATKNTTSARTPKAIKPEFMTIAQKKALKIDPTKKVQILQKTPDGKIAAYKIINKDSDILTSF